jgi:hypothetical protein
MLEEMLTGLRFIPFSAECPSRSSGADKHAGTLRHQGTADAYIAIAHSALFVNLLTPYAHVSQKKPEDYVHSSAQFYINNKRDVFDETSLWSFGI